MVRFLIIWQDVPTDADAFDRHYRETHIPLAKGMTGLRRYSLSRGLRPLRGREPYQVAELEWDDLETMRRDMESEAGRATADDVEVLKQWSPGVQSMIYELEDVH